MSEKPLPPELEELVRVAVEEEFFGESRMAMPLRREGLGRFARHVLRRAGVPGMMEERERLASRMEAIEHAGHDPDCGGMNEPEQRCGCGWLQREGAAGYIRFLEADRDALREERDALKEALQAMLTVREHGECEAMHPDLAEEMARAALDRKPKESS